MPTHDLLALLSEAARLLRSARRELWRRGGPSEMTEEMGRLEAEARAAIDAAERVA